MKPQVIYVDIPKPATAEPQPFDLQRCMAGEKVVSRDCRPYKFGAYNPDARQARKIIGWLGNRMIGHSVYGIWSSAGRESRSDLFMAPVEPELPEPLDSWIAIFSGASWVYDDYQSALAFAKPGRYIVHVRYVYRWATTETEGGEA